MQPLAGPKRTQAAYYQLKLGKGFFKQFSKVLGKDEKENALVTATLCRHQNTFSCIANTTERREVK
jgi:hypothetical protein